MSKILFFGKAHDAFVLQAIELLKKNGAIVSAFIGSRTERFPDISAVKNPDWIISYLSPWIIPPAVLNIAPQRAINFHPGPPEYPGIGCTNFAIYNGEKEFGVTCHVMNAAVDTGKILKIKRFELFTHDSVDTLTQRAYRHLSEVFVEMMPFLKTNTLPECHETWKRVPYRRQELNDLCALSLKMDAKEILRRVRALTFPNMPCAFLEIEGKKIELSLKK